MKTHKKVTHTNEAPHAAGKWWAGGIEKPHCLSTACSFSLKVAVKSKLNHIFVKHSSYVLLYILYQTYFRVLCWGSNRLAQNGIEYPFILKYQRKKYVITLVWFINTATPSKLLDLVRAKLIQKLLQQNLQNE